MSDKVRTRFAPSPTGYLHIGGLRTALYAYLFAKKHGGAFILRIEDTDQERLVPGAVEVITDTLRETGLHYDEGPGAGGAYGPYVQTERREIYKKCAEEIVERGGAYVCFCPKERLDELRARCEARGETFKYDKHCLSLPKEEVKARLEAGEAHVVRQNVPLTGQTSFDDLLFGRITVDNATLDDAVLVKSDGLPTYNFANVVDDHMMDITHVLRGTEYLSSTPKYNLVYESMGWDIPTYIHLPPVMKTASRKLSKRDGDASFGDFVQKGFLPEAILNYIALLGWNPGTNQEKFTLSELIEAFSTDGLNKAPAIFDVAKLTWLNGEYVRALAPEQFGGLARPYYAKAGCAGFDEEILGRILQPRVEYFAQIPEMLDFLPNRLDYPLELFTNKKMKTTPENSLEALELTLPVLRALEPFAEATLHDALLALAAEHELKNGRILWPLRVAVSGKLVSPGGAIEACALLGRDETVARVELAMEKLRKS